MTVYPYAAFEARRHGKQNITPLSDIKENIVDFAKRMWPLAEKLEETRRFHMGEEVRQSVAAYVERFGRVRALELWDEQREEILAQPLIPEKDFE